MGAALWAAGLDVGIQRGALWDHWIFPTSGLVTSHVGSRSAGTGGGFLEVLLLLGGRVSSVWSVP